MDRDGLVRAVLVRLERATGFRPIRQAQGGPGGSGGHWQCRCPAHKDVGPSLSVSAGRKGIVLKCFAGCEVQAVVEALGMKMADLFYGRPRRQCASGAPGAAGTAPGTPTADGREAFPDALAEWCWVRGVRLEAARAFGIVSDGPAIRAPMFDGRGKVTGWQRRRGDNGLFPLPAGPAKSYTERGGHNGVFVAQGDSVASGAPPAADAADGTPTAARRGPVLVVEGLPDAVAALSAQGAGVAPGACAAAGAAANAPTAGQGRLLVVGTPGATPGRRALRATQRLCAEREVVLFPHGDAAGRRWRDAVGGALADAGCTVRFVVPTAGEDLDDRLQR